MSDRLDAILFAEGENHEDYFNAIAPPIIQSSNFLFESTSEFKKAMGSEHSSHIYGRGNNPTVEILSKKMAALERTEAALMVASGAGAMSLAVMSQIKTGDHVICVRNPYSWTSSLLDNYLPRFGITRTYIEGDDLEELEGAIQSNSRVLILESPNSLTFGIQDLGACALVCKKHGLTSIVDNSYATPLFQQPATMGIDIVIHSISKYINGHSDVVSGAICSTAAIIQQIFYNEYMTMGPAVSPADAALIIRGMRTLPIRMKRIQETTEQIVAFMKRDSRISMVLYPFDPDFPQYDLAHRQMTGCGGLITTTINADSIEQMNAFADALEHFKLAVSWGGPESLVLPVSALYGQKGRPDPEMSWRVARFSIGLENGDCLVDDLKQALDRCGVGH
jgi:cystathionine beta-lyase/cystathionine gamma-synthase